MFLIYSASKNDVILKTGLGVVHCKWRRSIIRIDHDFLLVGRCKYSSILYHFRVRLASNNIVTLKSGLKVTQCHWNWYHSNALALCCIISQIKRYIGLKSRLFNISLHLTRTKGGPLRNIGIPFGAKTTTIVWLTDDEKSLRICVTDSTECRCVTDRRADRHLATA